MEAYLAQHQELKESAQRAFVAYIKSVFLMKNKQIFDVRQLDFNAFAHSLGLALTPRVRFLERLQKQQKVKVNVENNKNVKDLQVFGTAGDSEEEEASDFLQIKRADHEIEGAENAGEDEEEELPLPVPRKKKEKVVTKAALAKRALRKKLQVNEKRLFNEDGEEIIDPRKEIQSEFAKQAMLEAAEHNTEGGINLEISKKVMSEEDKFDKQRFRELVKQKRKKRKEKLKKQEDVASEEEQQEYDDDVADDSDENSVDLSWLPDPAKVYTKPNAEASQSETASSADDNDDVETDEEPALKRHKVTTKLSLNDAEIIAEQLLAQN